MSLWGLLVTIPKPNVKADRRAKKRAKQQSHDAFSEAVLAADDYRCANFLTIHDRTYGVTAHHIVRRGQQGPDTVENGVALCAQCHDRAERGDKKQTADEFVLWVLNQHRDSARWRWDEAAAHLKKRIAFKAGRTNRDLTHTEGSK